MPVSEDQLHIVALGAIFNRRALVNADAAQGTKLIVSCLEDEKVIVTVPAGAQQGTRLHGHGKGDLYVVVEVTIPTDLTARQRELLREFRNEESEKSTCAGL